ncbi:MAG TPA: hypothetical protein VF665_17000 [Longimicrobium sp.]|jgi:hypothetical protein|uniref:hypothetical protein n=1 Tax=Longimicrobium sp. TaxID=2029185 RepID=UPI002ED8F2E3
MIKNLRSVAVLALAMVAACENAPTGTDELTGGLAFTYASDNSPIGGTFNANGALSSNPQSGSWAAAAREGGDAAVVANEVLGQVINTAIINLPGVRTGAVTISEHCEEDCASLSFVVEQVIGDDADTYVCDMTSGNIYVTTLSADRVKGTFSGTGSCFSLEEPNEPSIRITNGMFDTPVVATPLGGTI